MTSNWTSMPQIPQPNYTYSKPITIRKWNGGFLQVIIGYVIKHPEKNCVVLEKQYVATKGSFKNEKFIIKNKDDWQAITQAIEKLWPEITEAPSDTEIDNAISKISQEMQLLDIISKYPDLLSRLPDDIEILSLPLEQKRALYAFLDTGGKLAQEVIEKLSQQEIKDVEDFKKILDQLKLSTINSLITHITSRLGFISLFEKTIHDDSSYERRGDDSVHNLLKENIWIVDRNYSILHDDETLKNIIYQNWGEVAEGESTASRPDFLCMSSPASFSEKQLVIIEIKRPSVKIKFKHIEQVMKYKTVLQKYSGAEIKKYKCYIVGREIDDTVSNNRLDNSGYIVKTYTDFISEARDFYSEYRKIIESGDKLSF